MHKTHLFQKIKFKLVVASTSRVDFVEINSINIIEIRDIIKTLLLQIFLKCKFIIPPIS